MPLATRPLLACLVLASSAPWSAEISLEAQAGETKLEAGEAGKFLEALSQRLAQTPCVRAKVETIVEDGLLGPEKRLGELVLQRPDRMLRRIIKDGKSYNAMRFEGTQFREYSRAEKAVEAFDFQRAPKKLELLRAALIVDVAVLQQYFEFLVFTRKAEDGQGAQARLVLSPKESLPKDIKIKRIQARIGEAQPFFSEIDTRYGGRGTDTLDKYLEIQAVKKLEAKSFADELLDKGPEKKVSVQDESKQE